MTDKPPSHLRSLHRDPSDLRVVARAPDDEGNLQRLVFPASNIDHLREKAADRCAVVLKSGVSLTVALAMDTLYDKIYRPDFRQGDTLDLTSYCVEEEKPADKKLVRKAFNDNAGPLTITAQVRKPETNSVANLTFSEADIRHYYAEATARSKSGQSVRIYFNAEMKKKLPFSSMTADYVMLDMPNADLLAALQKAKEEGTGKLDLCALFVANPKKYGLDPQ